MKRQYEIAVLSKGGYARTVRIYAPRRADRAIIMHDGQNVFRDEDATFKKSWRAVDILRSEKIKNTAIIGIDSAASRDDDYLPFKTGFGLDDGKTVGGNTDAYVDYIRSIIIPYLDKRFGFKFYGMLGSSAGATATVYFASKKIERVCAYGMFSTPLFVSPEEFDTLFAQKPFDKNAMYRIYVGGSETEDIPGLADKIPDLYVNDAFTLVKALRACGAKDIKLRLENQNVHDEISWREPEREFFKDFAALSPENL